MLCCKGKQGANAALGTRELSFLESVHYINKTRAKGIPAAPGKLTGSWFTKSQAVTNRMAKGGNIWVPCLMLLYCHPTTYSPKWALALVVDKRNVRKYKHHICGALSLFFQNTACNLTDI